MSCWVVNDFLNFCNAGDRFLLESCELKCYPAIYVNIFMFKKYRSGRFIYEFILTNCFLTALLYWIPICLVRSTNITGSYFAICVYTYVSFGEEKIEYAFNDYFCIGPVDRSMTLQTIDHIYNMMRPKNSRCKR